MQTPLTVFFNAAALTDSVIMEKSLWEFQLSAAPKTKLGTTDCGPDGPQVPEVPS